VAAALGIAGGAPELRRRTLALVKEHFRRGGGEADHSGATSGGAGSGAVGRLTSLLLGGNGGGSSGGSSGIGVGSDPLSAAAWAGSALWAYVALWRLAGDAKAALSASLADAAGAVQAVVDALLLGLWHPWVLLAGGSGGGGGGADAAGAVTTTLTAGLVATAGDAPFSAGEQEQPLQQHQPRVDVGLAVRELVRVHGHQLLLDGVYNADPHPGNVLVLQGGTLGLIDYGAARHASMHGSTLSGYGSRSSLGALSLPL